MKKIFIIMLTFVLLSFAGCSSNIADNNGESEKFTPTPSSPQTSNPAEYTTIDYEQKPEKTSERSKEEIMLYIFENTQYWDIGFMEEFLSVKENVPLDQIPKTNFPALAWYVDSCRYILMERSSIGNRFFDCIHMLGNDSFNLLKIDQDHVGAVFKTEYKNDGETFAIVVFERKIVNVDSEEKEYWGKTGEIYFFDRLGNFSDYKDVKVGDNVEDLYDLDKTTWYDVHQWNLSVNYAEKIFSYYTLTDEEANYRMVFKLLSDGVLTVEFKKDTMTITEIKFYPYADGEMPSTVNIKSADCLKAFINK